MNAGDVVKLLEQEGIVRTESSIKFLASKFNLYKDVDKSVEPYPGFDPEKVADLVRVFTSPLLLTSIASLKGVSRDKVNYICLSRYIPLEKRYGKVMLKNEGDLERVYSELEK
jgi:hypothetical protein